MYTKDNNHAMRKQTFNLFTAGTDIVKSVPLVYNSEDSIRKSEQVFFPQSFFITQPNPILRKESSLWDDSFEYPQQRV